MATTLVLNLASLMMKQSYIVSRCDVVSTHELRMIYAMKPKKSNLNLIKLIIFKVK